MKKYLLYFIVSSFTFIACESDDDHNDIDRTPMFELIQYYDTLSNETLGLVTYPDTINFNEFGAIHNTSGTFTVSGFTYKEEVNPGEGVDHLFRTRNVAIENFLFEKGQYSFREFEVVLLLTERTFLDDDIFDIEFFGPPSKKDSIAESSYFYIDEIIEGKNYVSGFFDLTYNVNDTIFMNMKGEFRNLIYSEP